MAVIDVQLRPAWRNYWLGLLIAGALLVMAVISFADGSGREGQMIAGLWLLGALAMLLFVAFKRFSWKFTIDDTRVSRHYGLVSRNQQSVRIRDLRSVELSQGIFQRLFGVGDLAFYSAGSDNAEVRFVGIRQPLEWRNRIDDAMDRLKDSGD
jgi:uncharacterized membrane protein YdbT with pleckstrin-like domain